MTQTYELVAKLKTDTSDFDNGMQSAVKTTENFSGRMTSMGKNVSTQMAIASTAVIGGLIVGMKGAFDAATESAQIARETERVIRTTGSAANATAEDISELAGSLSELTGKDDEMIQSGANLLLTFTNISNQVGENNDVFNQATGLALDMSTALGTDMKGASLQLGKALNDPVKGITALSKAGVSFTSEQKDMIRGMVLNGDTLGAQKIILEELAKEFGGAAEAAKTPMETLRTKIGNVQEAVGTMLMPAIGGAADALGFLTDSFLNLPGPMQGVIGITGAVVTALTFVGPVFLKIWEQAAPIFDALSKGFKSAIDGTVKMSTHFGASAEAAAKTSTSITSSLGTTLPLLGIAIGIALVAFTMWSNGQAEARERAKDFSKSLDEQTGAWTNNTDAVIRTQMEQKGVLDDLNNAGVGMDRWRRAIEGGTRGMLSQIDANKLRVEGLKNSNRITDGGTAAFASLKQEMVDSDNAVNIFMASLAENGDLTGGMITLLREEAAAYEEKRAIIEATATANALANGVSTDGAIAAGKAAVANAQEAESIKTKMDAMRALTDPMFAAFQSQNALTAAQNTYKDVMGDSTKSVQEKRAASVALTKAYGDYGFALKNVEKAMLSDAEAAENLQAYFDMCKRLGLDPASEAAQTTLGAFMGLGGEIDKLNAPVSQAQTILNNLTVSAIDPMSEAAKSAREKLYEMGYQLQMIDGVWSVVKVSIEGADDVTRQLRAIEDAAARISGLTVGFDGRYYDAEGNVIVTPSFGYGAMGASMSAGTPLIVGERGPELFMPPMSGRLIPNNKLVGAYSANRENTMVGGHTYNVNITVGPTADKASIGQTIVEAISSFEKRSGNSWRSK
jgi:hypothetical protein